MPTPDRLFAPAKLTRRLEVVGRREDGFHLLDAEMVSLDLADELAVSVGSGLEVIDEVAWSGQPGTAPPDPPTPAAGSNLVERALAAVGRSAHVTLTKRIPAAAGLGGASADAAAILRWAGVRDLALAARLGADVPFCVAGGRARLTGIGEEVEVLEPDLGAVYLLVTPRLPVSTPVVYAAWDELGGPKGDFGNDLEPAALHAVPGLRWWRDVMAAVTGERPRLAGSGGTWFIESSTDRFDELVGLAAHIRAEVVYGWESALVSLARAIGPSTPGAGG